jgi:hypothetical protein
VAQGNHTCSWLLSLMTPSTLMLANCGQQIELWHYFALNSACGAGRGWAQSHLRLFNQQLCHSLAHGLDAYCVLVFLQLDTRCAQPDLYKAACAGSECAKPCRTGHRAAPKVEAAPKLGVPHLPGFQPAPKWHAEQ